MARIVELIIFIEHGKIFNNMSMLELFQQIILNKSFLPFTVVFNGLMLNQHISGLVVGMLPARPGIEKDVIGGFVGVGLDDLFFGENVVEMRERLLVGRLWVGEEFGVHENSAKWVFIVIMG